MKWRTPHRFVPCSHHSLCPSALLHAHGIEHCVECLQPEQAPIHAVEDETPVEQTAGRAA